MSSKSVKVLGKHDVQKGDQLIEDVSGVGLEEDAVRRSLRHYAIDVEAMGRVFEEVKKGKTGFRCGVHEKQLDN